MAKREIAVLAALTASCAATPPSGLPPAPPVAPPSPVAPAASVPPPEVRTTAHLPKRVTYDARTLGIAASSFAVTVVNGGATPIATGSVRVVVAASRDGVAIPCGPARATSDDREPSAIEPGRSATLARDLDCAFALPGTYAVEVRAAIGDQPAEVVASQEVDVAAASSRVPQPVAGQPGLYAIVSGDPIARPRPPAAWARGDYAAVVGLVNGSAKPIALGPVKLAFDVYRQGSTVRCAGEVRDVAAPDALAPWRATTLRAPITCAPQGEGEFVIVGKIAVGAAPLADIGRFDLRITNDPTLFTPLPERSGPGGPPYEHPRNRPPF